MDADATVTHQKPVSPTERLAQFRAIAGPVYALVLLVLALIVAGGTLHLRVHLREHLAQRDGEILTAVALARQYANGAGSNLVQRLKSPADQLTLALEISQIKEGVLGVRLFDSRGRLETAVPPTLTETHLDANEVATLQRLQPVSRFHEHARLEDYFWVAPPNSARQVPLLEVNIPLYPRGHSNLVAAAQLLLDGRPVAAEYARIDRHLWALGSGLFVSGACLLSGVLWWAYRRLRQAHALVAERTARLLRANHELALAAKTSALGSVTAHLIHGLSNPLANLQDFLASHSTGTTDDDFQALAAATHRMQQLVQEVVRVLGEDNGADQYQISLAELAVVLKERHGTLMRDHGLTLQVELKAQGVLANRHANLALLILENLIHNAVKATPRGGQIKVQFTAESGGVCCLVTDQGPGIDAVVLPRLFTPCHSTTGGSGLGLAIGKQLANQMGAVLELRHNSSQGCVFALCLPKSILSDAEVSAANQEPLPSS